MTSPRWAVVVVGSVGILADGACSSRSPIDQDVVVATSGTSRLPPTVVESMDVAALARRSDAHRLDLRDMRGRRDVRNLALDDEIADLPLASSSAAGANPLLAVDGDATTAWRGAPDAKDWTWTLPFRRIVHLGLVRAHFGDASTRGVPGEYRWEYQPPVNGRCEPWALWSLVPGARHDDRDGNVFLYGPKDAHAQRQALFTDVDACAVRLVVTGMDGGVGPVVREVKLLESARSVARGPGVRVDAPPGPPVLRTSTPEGLVDGTYEKPWAGAAGIGRWEVTIRLPEPLTIDRLSLMLGYDATTVPFADKPGRRFSAAYLPTRYRIATSHDDDPAHLLALREGDSPVDPRGAPLPVRRRLVRFDAPRPVKMVRITVTEATGEAGTTSDADAAPVFRDVGLFAADDAHPVVTEPLFLSVDANPAGLTDRLDGGEAFADGLFARDAFHRLRRIVLGFDADTRWPSDATKKRDAGTGRFLEVIEGDDPLLTRELLTAMSPPPVVMLSGSFDWEFDGTTAPSTARRGHWSWDVTAPATDPDRGMGQLRSAVRARVAPFVGFCGGAQILALLEAATTDDDPSTSDDERALLDAVLIRNENRPIRGLLTRKNPYERAWWSDLAESDASRPIVRFEPTDPLFDTGATTNLRRDTRELPMSHGDMLRRTAFGTVLPAFKLVAESTFCRPWVASDGPEPTTTDPADPKNVCVRVPQAFRSVNAGYPIVGFQFHPEQRDFPRLAPADRDDAKGDALNVFANSIDLAIESWLKLWWPNALESLQEPGKAGRETHGLENLRVDVPRDLRRRARRQDAARGALVVGGEQGADGGLLRVGGRADRDVGDRRARGRRRRADDLAGVDPTRRRRHLRRPRRPHARAARRVIATAQTSVVVRRSSARELAGRGRRRSTMAIGSVSESASRGRPLDAEVNMVPMIDLLISTIAFLMLTAVWSHAARLAATAQVPGAPSSTSPPPERAALHVEVEPERFSLVWKQGQAVVRTAEIPRVPVPDAHGVHYPELASAVAREWATKPDEGAGLAIVHVDDRTRFADVAAVTDAVLAPKRADLTPAFAVALAAH